MRQTVKEVEKLSELLKDVANTHTLLLVQRERTESSRVIFSELTPSENMLQYKCKKGFQALSSRFVADGDLTGSRTRLPSLKSLCPN